MTRRRLAWGLVILSGVIGMAAIWVPDEWIAARLIMTMALVLIAGLVVAFSEDTQ